MAPKPGSKKTISGVTIQLDPKPKTTAQGRSKNTNLAATSRNGRRKRYRGQGN